MFGAHLRVATAACHWRLVKEREELVIFVLSNWIELVIVTSATLHGQAQPNGAQRFDLIEDILDAILFRYPTAFAVDHMIATKAQWLVSARLLRSGVDHLRAAIL